jgi:cell division protein FtsN
MKLTNVNTILIYVSLLLAIAIFCSIVFGCYFKNHKIEKFSDTKDSKNNTKSTIKDSKDKEEKKVLSKFENDILTKLSKGDMDNEEVEKLIKAEKFTKDNLSNIIEHLEQKISKK